MSQVVTGPLPALEEPNTFFWTAGAEGELRFQRCGDCGHWLHPPGVICPECRSENLAPQAVSGLATVAAVTINYQPWMPGLEVPYAIAIVALDEQPALHLTTNIVGIPPEEVFIGQRVRVQFEQREDVWLPLFTPVDQ
jgi:uncharacterized OB-fold protein